MLTFWDQISDTCSENHQSNQINPPREKLSKSTFLHLSPHFFVYCVQLSALIRKLGAVRDEKLCIM